MFEESPYRKSVRILDLPFVSCYIYHMIPGGREQRHYHDGIEIEYVLSGSSKTHKSRHVYFRKRGEVHEGENDSNTDLVFLCLTIPAESNSTTHYL